MNQVFIGGITLIITFILWSSRKQSKGSTFLKSQKDSFSNTQATSSWVLKNRLENQKHPKIVKEESEFFSSHRSLNSIEKKKQLTKLISSHPNDRLLAIQIATQWKNKQAIPFLRRGLKDSDSRVVIASASAISSYKGKAIDLGRKTQASHPPRNVSRMR